MSVLEILSLVLVLFAIVALWRLGSAYAHMASSAESRAEAERSKAIAMGEMADSIGAFVRLAQREYKDRQEAEEERKEALREEERHVKAAELADRFLVLALGGDEGDAVPDGWELRDDGWSKESDAYRLTLTNKASGQMIRIYADPDDWQPLAIGSCELWMDKHGTDEDNAHDDDIHDELGACTWGLEASEFAQFAADLKAYLLKYPTGNPWKKSGQEEAGLGTADPDQNASDFHASPRASDRMVAMDSGLGDLAGAKLVTNDDCV